MRTKGLVLICAVLCFTSCKTYQVMHYKGAELDKVGDVKNYTVYVHSKGGTYKVNKPSVSTAGVKGALVPVTDKSEIAEIKNPSTPHLIKKHRHDLNLFTPTEIKDSTLNLKKSEINDITRTVSHSKVDIGDILITVFGLAISLALIAGLVYWISIALGA